jgi:hypothetical protein
MMVHCGCLTWYDTALHAVPTQYTAVAQECVWAKVSCGISHCQFSLTHRAFVVLDVHKCSYTMAKLVRSEQPRIGALRLEIA